MKRPARAIDLIVPDLGVSDSQRVTVSAWLARVGDEIIEGDRLVELLLDEITFDVASPVSGRLLRILAPVDDSVVPGTVLARILPEPSEPDPT